MLSGTRQPEEIVAQFPAYGGSILLGTEALPETLPALESPDIHDNRTVFETVVAKLDSAEKVRRQNACFALDNAGEQERCFDDLVSRQDYPSDRFRPLLGAIPLRPPGEVHAFDYGERPGAGFASFLSGTRAFETARMPLYDPDPDAVEVFALGRRLPGFAANAKSVTQWQALSTEIIARDLALEISSRVLLELASTDNIIVEELELVTDVRRPTAYPGLGLQMTATERAVSEFVCADTYRQAFNSPAGLSYWQSLLRLEVALCSPEHLGIPVWYAPAALEKSPLSVRQSLEFFQREDIANRLESAIVELAAIEVDQSILLNELRRLAEERDFRERTQALEAALADAERAAKDPTLLEYAAGLGDLVDGASGLLSGTGELVAIWKGFPERGNDSVADYMFSKRDKLAEAGKDLSRSAGTLSKALALLDAQARDNAGDQARQIRRLLSEMRAAHDALLSEIQARTDAYRTHYDLLNAEVLDLSRQRDLTRALLVDAMPEIVALNAFSNILRSGGPREMLLCGEALESHSSTNLGTSYGQLARACIEGDERFNFRRQCVGGGDGARQTIARSEKVAILVASRPAQACFN